MYINDLKTGEKRRKIDVFFSCLMNSCRPVIGAGSARQALGEQCVKDRFKYLVLVAGMPLAVALRSTERVRATDAISMRIPSR